MDDLFCNMKGLERKQPWHVSEYYLGIHLELLIGIMRDISLNTQYPGQDLNQTPPVWKSDVLLQEPHCLMLCSRKFWETIQYFYMFQYVHGVR